VALVKFGRRVKPNLVGYLPRAWRPFPAQRMALPRLRVDFPPLPQNGVGNAAVALCQRHEFQAAMFVLVVVPLHEFQHPFAHLNDAAERLF